MNGPDTLIIIIKLGPTWSKCECLEQKVNYYVKAAGTCRGDSGKEFYNI